MVHSDFEQLMVKYRWAREIEAWSLAVVADRSVADVLDIYGGDPGQPVGDFTFAQLRDLQGTGEPEPLRFHVQVFCYQSHVIAVENNGWSGSFPEIARRCSSSGGHFFSVYWNVHAFGLVTESLDGRITSNFEHLYPFSQEQYPWTIRPEWAVGPDLDDDSPREACLTHMEQQTGVTADPRWLSEPQPTYRIPEPYWLYRDVEGAEKP